MSESKHKTHSAGCAIWSVQRGIPKNCDCGLLHVESAPAPEAEGMTAEQAIIEACIVNFLSWDTKDWKKTLSDLIGWECRTALDPKVSQEARELARAEVVRALEGHMVELDNIISHYPGPKGIAYDIRDAIRRQIAEYSHER